MPDLQRPKFFVQLNRLVWILIALGFFATAAFLLRTK
jgi:hypothetical protein